MDVNVKWKEQHSVRKEQAGFPPRLYLFSLVFAKTPVDILEKKHDFLFREYDPFYLYELIWNIPGEAGNMEKEKKKNPIRSLLYHRR